jgi:2,3-bisphosphoglycerate-independent phosphoglycerate mutase
MSKKPVILTILDGWGQSEKVEGNAVALAKKPTFDRLWANYPHTFINTSGPFVGLPEGQMGNSEVGHMNIGAGRVLLMDVTRIDVAIDTGDFFKNEKLLASMERGRQHALHLMGLLSDGGVHSHINHLFALLEMAKRSGVANVYVHCFLDGRDTPPTTGAGFVQQLQAKMNELGIGKIASVSGRYYSMDRDKRWERTQRGFESMVLGNGIHTTDPVAAIQASYAKDVTDEFVEPITIVDAADQPVGLVKDNDACIFFNYRADRGRQLSRAFLNEKPGSIGEAPANLHFTCMTQYDATINAPVAFAPIQPTNILADVLGKAGLKNLRTAETEKYPHVTFYFNGGNEKPYPGEERELVPSPKVATYDLMPEMSAAGITDVVVRAIEEKKFDVIIMNYANGDMVGHSGKLEPTIKAIEAVDQGLTRIDAALRANGGGSWLITADHGNAETMVDPVTGGPHTYHTTNVVPLIYVSDENVKGLKSGGALKDLSPTILGIMGIPKPAEMTGEDLREL